MTSLILSPPLEFIKTQHWLGIIPTNDVHDELACTLTKPKQCCGTYLWICYLSIPEHIIDCNEATRLDELQQSFVILHIPAFVSIYTPATLYYMTKKELLFRQI